MHSKVATEQKRMNKSGTVHINYKTNINIDKHNKESYLIECISFTSYSHIYTNGIAASQPVSQPHHTHTPIDMLRAFLPMFIEPNNFCGIYTMYRTTIKVNVSKSASRQEIVGRLLAIDACRTAISRF